MQTNRLIHKPFTHDDLDALIELRSDPEVVKYLGGERAMTRGWNEMRLDFYISCYPKGLGLHKMFWRESGQLIGWSGLQPLEGGEEIEVSYGMIRDFWGKSIGTETALAWLEFGFSEKNLDRIVAVADEHNVASWKIMEKLGMTFDRKQQHYGMDCVVYAITQEEWEK